MPWCLSGLWTISRRFRATWATLPPVLPCTYTAVTDQMKQASAARMENYIKGVVASKG